MPHVCVFLDSADAQYPGVGVQWRKLWRFESISTRTMASREKEDQSFCTPSIWHWEEDVHRPPLSWAPAALGSLLGKTLAGFLHLRAVLSTRQEKKANSAFFLCTCVPDCPQIWHRGHGPRASGDAALGHPGARPGAPHCFPPAMRSLGWAPGMLGTEKGGSAQQKSARVGLRPLLSTDSPGDLE